jgi:hypothetical protein
LGHSLGLDFVAGGGYSYPPPFAVAMVPLASLPFRVAVALFVVVSVAVFAATIAWWLPRSVLGGGGRRRRALLALGAGLYPPVAGSVFAGQANLLVLGLLGVGLAPFIPGRGIADGRGAGVGSGVMIGLAGIVKLAPLALVAPLALAVGRVRGALAVLAGIVLAVVGSLALAVALAPAAGRGASGLAELFAADPFSTNQSINGAISRLFLDGDRTSALLSGDPAPWIVAATVLLAAATFLVLLRAVPALGEGRVLALALALSITAAAVGAPKNSFWNDVPVLLAVALALAAGGLGGTPGRRALVGAWIVATVAQALVDRWLALPGAPRSPALTVVSSAGTVGLLALWLGLAIGLLATIADPGDGRPAPAEA